MRSRWSGIWGGGAHSRYMAQGMFEPSECAVKQRIIMTQREYLKSNRITFARSTTRRRRICVHAGTTNAHVRTQDLCNYIPIRHGCARVRVRACCGQWKINTPKFWRTCLLNYRHAETEQYSSYTSFNVRKFRLILIRFPIDMPSPQALHYDLTR